MRGLLVSHSFHPNIGGIETTSAIFARGFVERGHGMTVVTHAAGPEVGYPFEVVRQADSRCLLSLVRRADFVWHNNVNLRSGWPLALAPRPLIVTHQTWLARKTGWGPTVRQLKRAFCACAQNVFISAAVGKAAGLSGVIIPNPYDDAIFRRIDERPRECEIIFVGRLVSDKGADVLIEALATLAARRVPFRATVVGEGPERKPLELAVAASGLAERIAFLGTVEGAALARELNRHKILVVPSRWEEPFGIVALEGAACGCAVVGTQGGGLPEAIGPSGPVLPNGDPLALANCLEALIDAPDRLAGYRNAAIKHVEGFTIKSIVDRYERLITDVVKGKNAPRAA